VEGGRGSGKRGRKGGDRGEDKEGVAIERACEKEGYVDGAGARDKGGEMENSDNGG